ncbi:DNA repair protein RecO [Cesiribacter andamanensis]|uniref:DNA repair protein RecO n=1 Tax=Cesiribacter andamanensis AMV16 TaxID=1279009 RepID=M7N8M7_9BACT|nr:DNA repair protein RecO [Cesiribacter andamanensis]EMR03617.1 DNA repair protein RecO [Cesiribacter andamanensis AMV16]
MLQKTKGIVLSYIRYRETSIIVKIYTEVLGLQSYIVNGVRSSGNAKSGGGRMGLYQPLTLLELVVYHQERANLHRIREIKCPEPFVYLPMDFQKTGIVLFLTELLSKSLKSEEPNPVLYQFLHHSIHVLDGQQEGVQNFHLQFLLKLSRYLGFATPTADDFLEEVSPYISADAIDREAVERLLLEPYGAPIPLNGERRRHVLQMILQFYRLHVADFGDLKSLPVLQEMQG